MVAGIEAGLRTVLVLTGSTRQKEVSRFPYRPTLVLDSIAGVVPPVVELAPDEYTELSRD